MTAARTGLALGAMLAALSALVAVLAGVAPAGAQDRPTGVITGTRVAIGISDNKPDTFTDPNFFKLGAPYSRLVVPYDGVTTEPARIDLWIEKARAAGTRPLFAIEHRRSDQCQARGGPCRLPSVRVYARAFKRFRARYPDVVDYTAWNEGNHSSQPTAKKPKQAALYYNAAKRACRRCRIVAADVLDGKNLPSWLRTFKRYAKKPRLWGLHNYSDTNRPERRGSGTRQMLKYTRGEVWITETGGVVSFKTFSGRVSLACDEERGARSIHEMARLARTNRRFRRLYIYQWKIDFVGNRFDAGIVRPDGSPRPSYTALQEELGISPTTPTQAQACTS